MLTWPRDTRFNEFGVINDPDCTPGDATTGYLDRCADPESAGVIGIRKFPNPSGGPPLIGVTCAACHAGLDPVRPPSNPNHPHRKNIHPTVGNQYLQIGKIFKAHLSPHDPRYQVFSSWAPGTVDTTVLENDHINNPGMITPVWAVPDRPFFDVTVNGEPARVHRNGQGGEDDAGCELATLRVYFNIGMCAKECMMGHLANGPGGSQTPIDLAQCRNTCPDLVRAEESVGKLCAFLQTPRSPHLVNAHGGHHFVDWKVVEKGKKVFSHACGSCHSDVDRSVNHHSDGDRSLKHNVLSDDLIHPFSEIGTNSCRALTTNWMAGHLGSLFLRPIQGAAHRRPRFLPGHATGRHLGDRPVLAQ